MNFINNEPLSFYALVVLVSLFPSIVVSFQRLAYHCITNYRKEGHTRIVRVDGYRLFFLSRLDCRDR